MVESRDSDFVAVLVVFPPVSGVISDGRGGSCIDDGFGGIWCNWLEVYRDYVVVLLYCNPLGMVEEVSDEADLDGVHQAWNFV